MESTVDLLSGNTGSSEVNSTPDTVAAQHPTEQHHPPEYCSIELDQPTPKGSIGDRLAFTYRSMSGSKTSSAFSAGLGRGGRIAAWVAAFAGFVSHDGRWPFKQTSAMVNSRRKQKTRFRWNVPVGTLFLPTFDTFLLFAL